ncbi:MAG: hypothetical protein OEM81_02745 [Acidimicrobiia bacterium]|nr:hypothetical protein [Acidimicrobiia bacterium]MDH3396732.1 hypothetical protein [Acidimicrobiia bacterium]
MTSETTRGLFSAYQSATVSMLRSDIHEKLDGSEKPIMKVFPPGGS